MICHQRNVRPTGLRIGAKDNGVLPRLALDPSHSRRPRLRLEEQPMGNAQRKLGEIPDEHTGLTEREMVLVQESWRSFCSHNREYGVLIFISMFVKHPEYLPMFRNFRGKNVATLKDDPVFRAHGCSIGYHVTSMVESIGDPAALEVLVRRNATEHLRRKGVKPHHFEVLGECLMSVLQSREERLMTPDAIEGWKKFLKCMVAIITDVFEKAAAERAERGSVSSAMSSTEESALTSSYRTADVTGGSQTTGSRRTPAHKTGAGRKIGASSTTKGGGSEPHKPEHESPMKTPPEEAASANDKHQRDKKAPHDASAKEAKGTDEKETKKGH
ncbi:hypothetical protein HPB50_021337 [Hyalomma asiaticum]|uniref:Uncharacterized protein n=1 Tax=Hyalomma asiaticum TaxID=266040 RepID=A0ACB7SND2_HYAAI|nr:hypothetical protein HPB50_021337 [Hyalomma asiaticum]